MINKKILMFLASFALLLFLVNGILAEDTNLTIEQKAANCLKTSREIMQEMGDIGFSVIRVNDSLKEAQDLYNAQRVLTEKGNKADFSLVLPYCEKIQVIKDTAFNARDELDAFKKFYKESAVEGMNTSSVDAIVLEAENEIKNERYEKVKPLVNKAYEEITNIKSSYTTLNLFYKSTTRTIATFLKENWIIILVILIVLVAVLFIFQKAISKWWIKTKIYNLEIRKNTLKELIMKTQKDYFEKGNVSESTYNIKTKKFAELIRDIDRQVPLLKEELMKVSKNKEESKESNESNERAKALKTKNIIKRRKSK